MLAPWADHPSGDKPAIYHCISRVVNREFVLGDEEKAQFLEFMLNYAAFSGVHVLTYGLMSNHFHLLLEVPPKAQLHLSDAELFERLRYIYDEDAMLLLNEEFARFEDGMKKVHENWKSYSSEAEAVKALAYHEAEKEAFRQRFLKRMHDLSFFMKALKQRFTQWFCKKGPVP